MIKVEDKTCIEQSTFYFTSFIYLPVRFDAEIIKRLEKKGAEIKNYAEGRNKEYFSEFFTSHFKELHHPINILIGNQEATLSISKLKEIDNSSGLNRFQDLDFPEGIQVKWHSFITANGLGMIIGGFRTDKEMAQSVHRKLSLIYLNYPIIDISGIDYLANDTDKEESDGSFISLEELMSRFKSALVKKIKAATDEMPQEKFENYKILPASSWETYESSIKYESIIPIINLVVNKGIDTSQKEWIDEHKELVAYYIAKPELFEMGRLSTHYINNLIKKERIYTISENSFSVGSYHGIVRIQFQREGKYCLKDDNKYSGFWMETKASFLYTSLLAIQNYFTLRIFDEYLDNVSDRLFETRKTHFKKRASINSLIKAKKEVKREIEEIQEDPLGKINFISEILRNTTDQVEEVRNIDKLIDSDPHIKLYNIIESYLKLDEWNEMVKRKLERIDHYANNIEYVKSSKDDHQLQRILFAIAIIQTFFGIFEMLSFITGLLG